MLSSIIYLSKYIYKYPRDEVGQRIESIDVRHDQLLQINGSPQRVGNSLSNSELEWVDVWLWVYCQRLLARSLQSEKVLWMAHQEDANWGTYIIYIIINVFITYTFLYYLILNLSASSSRRLLIIPITFYHFS